MKASPFKYGCVVGEGWYCARPFLEKELSRLVRGGRNVQSAEFLSSAGISNAASARKALNRLAELRHIYKYRGEWRFNGNFFRAWLKRFA